MKLTKAQAEAAKARILKAVGEVQKELVATYNGAEVLDDDGETVIKTLTFKFSEPAAEDVIELGGKQATKTLVQAQADTTEDIVKKATDAALLALKATQTKQEPLKTQTKAADASIEVISRYKSARFLGKQRVKMLDGTVEEQSGEERAYGFGMWALSAIGNHPMQEEAHAYCRRKGLFVQKVQSENINTAGGYFVPEQFGTDLIDLKETYGLARQLFMKVPMTSDTRSDPRRTGGLTGFFVGENGAGTESTTSWDQVRLVAKDLMVLSRMSMQVNADSVISWADRLAYEIAYAETLKEDQCAFLGDGTSTYGGIQSLDTRIRAVWVTAQTTAGYGLIKQATGTTGAAVVLADAQRVVASIPRYADTGNACWVCHRTTYYSLFEPLLTSLGGVTKAEGVAGTRGPVPIFLGYPVRFAQAMPATQTSGQTVAYFGDFGLAASFGDRMQDSIAFSTEATVNGQSMWERAQIGIRGIERFDINVHDVGNGTQVTGVGPVVAFAIG